MKISTLKKGLQKRNDPATGKPFKLGTVREDGKVFWGYTSHIRQDGKKSECWLDPKKYEIHRAKQAEISWAKRGADCTKETRSILREKQNGKCEICSRDEVDLGKKLSLDHCHSTNKVRGLLCSDCNFAIGNLKDNPELCFRAAEYLVKHSNLFTELVYG